ncbi:MAG: PAC2 family protein [Methanomassiliicoccales archaeon]
MSESTVFMRNLKEVRFEKGVMIEAFTGVGMVASIAANFLIASLKLDQVAAMDSNDFPPVSMVYNGRPKLPCRIYCSSERNIAVFTGEVPLPQRKHREVASELIKWALGAGCTSFISLDAIPVEEEEEEKGEPNVWAIGATDAARESISKASLESLSMGMITGVSAIMLNRGRMDGLDVIGLFAEARPYIPDAAAAAALIEKLKLLLGDRLSDISAAPLLEEARSIQSDLEKIRKQAEPAMRGGYELYR